MGIDKHNWFEKWFNTPYYHLLYNNRTHIEADQFISKLVYYLKLKKESRFWDLACGKGRHAIALNKLGYNVIGTDLSEESIKEALTFENESLQFYRLDMRCPFRTNYFDAVLNLFTSFGYFQNANDDVKVFKSVSNSLKPNGVFVFDYLNKNCVVANLQTKHEIIKDDVKFIVTKHLEQNSVVKHIQVFDKQNVHEFCESVKLYDVQDILAMAEKCGLKKEATFGDYELNEYGEKSNRMIIVFRKLNA